MRISFIKVDRNYFIFYLFVIVLFSLYFVSAHQLEVERGVVIDEYSVIRDNSNQFKIFVGYINLENSTIKLKRISFYDLNNPIFIKSEIFNRAFPPSYYLFAKEQELKDKLTLPENKNDKRLLKEYNKLILTINKSIFFKEFTFNTNEFSLIPEIDGDHIRLRVRVELEKNGKTEIIEEEKDILISEPLPLPQNSLTQISTQNITNYSPFINGSNFVDDPSQGNPGWFVGDQHVHSRYGTHLFELFLSFSSLNTMTSSAISADLDWLLFTDHSFAVTPENFDNGTMDCNRFSNSSFFCSFGQEMSVGQRPGCDSWYNSHYLSYAPSYIDGRCGAVPYCSCREEQPIVNEVNNAGGFGFIAHPYQTVDRFMNISYTNIASFDWDNWSVTGYGGMEILSASDGIWEADDTQSRNKWDELLRAETNPSNGFVVGIANSDAHRTGELGHSFTYCYLGSLTGANIRNALKEGKCTLSNGPFLEFTIQGSSAKIGERANILSGQNVLNIQAKSNSQFGNIIMINVVVDGVYVDTFSTPTGQNYVGQRTINLNPQNKYIRLEVFTANGQRALTNPIWLSVSSQSCQCSSWNSGACGAGPCASDERLETRTCSPSGCDFETQCVFDPSCNNPGGQLSTCNEPGYEHCLMYQYGNCDVGLAINRYENINNIQWGVIDGINSPYAVNEYKIGWRGIMGADYVYYNMDPSSCQYGGCSGNQLPLQGTMTTINAPGTAYHENILAYDDTSSYWCSVRFDAFAPYYNTPAGTRPVYVLNCYNATDCQQGYYCDKSSADWRQWQCVSGRANGNSCTENSQCSSGYCDRDGLGLADDNWCFAPYNNYFDGQESAYCEVSTTRGSAFCDERRVGDDLNFCQGILYYEEECSSICGLRDVTNIFECTDSGCSCQESLCDGKRIGEPINTCSSQRVYFADKCTATAGGEDRDNVCRASTFSLSCTADIECDGVIAGTGACSTDCRYSPPNNPPIITSTPVTQGFAGTQYNYQVRAYDPENDTLTFGLVWGPQGMTINSQSGLIQWLPTQTGNYSVNLSVTDRYSAPVTQSYNLGISDRRWSSDIRLITNNDYSAMPFAVGDLRGNLHFIWSSFIDNNLELYYTKLNNSRGVLINNLRLTNAPLLSMRPTALIDAGDNVNLIWQDARYLQKPELYFKRLSNFGLPIVSDTRLTSTIDGVREHSAVLDLNQNIHIAWEDRFNGSTAYYKKISRDGSSLINNLRLANVQSKSKNPSIAVDSQNNLNMVWSDNRNGNYEIYFKKLNANGTILMNDARFTNTHADSMDVSILIDSSNNIHLVWTETLDDNADVYYKKLNNLGFPLINDLRLTNNEKSFKPSFIADNENNIHVIWNDYSREPSSGNCPPSCDSEVKYKKLNNNGVILINDVGLTNASFKSKEPSIAIDSQNKVYVAWQDIRSGNNQIYYKFN